MKQIRKLLLDALLACQALQRSTVGVTFEQYSENEEKQAAIERWLILIGEALNQASAIDPDLGEQIPELRRIVGMRNRLVHAYDQTDQEIVMTRLTRRSFGTSFGRRFQCCELDLRRCYRTM